jgi:hypothetical protein
LPSVISVNSSSKISPSRSGLILCKSAFPRRRNELLRGRKRQRHLQHRVCQLWCCLSPISVATPSRNTSLTALRRV